MTLLPLTLRRHPDHIEAWQTSKDGTIAPLPCPTCAWTWLALAQHERYHVAYKEGRCPYCVGGR